MYATHFTVCLFLPFFRTYENENGENSKHMTEVRFVHAVTAGDIVKFLSAV